MADQVFNAKCGFFDSVNNDRLYSAEEMNRPYRRLISNGVFATPQGIPSTDLQVVSAKSGLNIIIKKGQGIFGDKWFEFEADATYTVPPNNNVVPRRDSVIVQIDKRQTGRKGQIVYRTGTPNSSPTPPAIGTVENVIEYRIANIYVAASANYIGQDAIVDLRGSSECPWVTQLIKQVDTSQLYNQWNAAYQNYYDTETKKFNEFVAGLTSTLQVNTNIVTSESSYTPTVSTTEIPINIAGFNKSTDVLLVFANGQRINNYTVTDNTKITLASPVGAEFKFNFLVMKSVVDVNNASTLSLVTEMNNKLSELTNDSDWINFTLEKGTSFDGTTIPAIRKVGDKVYIRGAIKGLDTVNVPICTLPTNMRPAMNHYYTVNAVEAGNVVASCTLEIRTTGSIYLISKSATITPSALLPINTNFVLG